MKQIIRTACIAVASAAIFASCKKDDDKNNNNTGGNSALLTSGNWKLISDQEKIGNDPWQEMIDFYDDCELDNFLKFNTTTVVYNDGPTKCDPADQQEYVFPWTFQSNGAKLNIDGEVVDIEELSATRMILTSSETTGGTTIMYKQIFEH